MKVKRPTDIKKLRPVTLKQYIEITKNKDFTLPKEKDQHNISTEGILGFDDDYVYIEIPEDRTGHAPATFEDKAHDEFITLINNYNKMKELDITRSYNKDNIANELVNDFVSRFMKLHYQENELNHIHENLVRN
jgi:hypothetical protein